MGWGALPEVFDSTKENWQAEYAELKGLLTDAEYMAAMVSVLNAHYTSPTVIKAIYSGLAKLGFANGKILEPACGVGNFFGLLPEEMQQSQLYGVELDSLTGRIVRLLYPDANIQIKGFEQTNFRDNSFDVVVGNVPFGNYSVNDKPYNKLGFSIHNYFFAKVLDKVHPSGVLALQMDEKIPDTVIQNQQAELNRLYDNFSKKFSLINDRANRLAFSQDNVNVIGCTATKKTPPGSYIDTPTSADIENTSLRFVDMQNSTLRVWLLRLKIIYDIYGKEED